MPPYPFYDGDFIVLGPECFTSRDERVICFRGANYVRVEERTAVSDELESAVDRVSEAATESITLDRWQLWTLRVGAAGAVISAVAHISGAVRTLVRLWPF